MSRKIPISSFSIPCSTFDIGLHIEYIKTTAFMEQSPVKCKVPRDLIFEGITSFPMKNKTKPSPGARPLVISRHFIHPNPLSAKQNGNRVA